MTTIGTISNSIGSAHQQVLKRAEQNLNGGNSKRTE